MQAPILTLQAWAVAMFVLKHLVVTAVVLSLPSEFKQQITQQDAGSYNTEGCIPFLKCNLIFPSNSKLNAKDSFQLLLVTDRAPQGAAAFKDR